VGRLELAVVDHSPALHVFGDERVGGGGRQAGASTHPEVILVVVSPGRDFTLSDEDVRALPIDAVAMEILRDVISNQEWNSNGWILAARGGRQYSELGIAALKEAWQWLYNNGLIANNYESSSLYAIQVTRLGYRVLADGVEAVRAFQRLAMELHPILEAKVRAQYLMGEWELAALAALKAVEVRVRAMAGESDSKIGVKLMRGAFGTEGPLFDPALDGGESIARMELFAGAIGLFKNPTSHRDVVFDDPAEAAEVILLADLLMRILDRIEGARATGE
jgi:uncharacterized protein (TIGR02391 family)